MSEHAQPDVMDRGGRLRRLVLALIVGACAAALGYVATRACVPSEELGRPRYYLGRRLSADGFVMYMAALAGAVAFTVTLVVGNLVAKRRWQRERVPAARQLR